jgi:hypothetical protein
MVEFIGPLHNLLHFTNHHLRLDTVDFWPHYTNPFLRKSKSKSVTLRLTVSQSVSYSVELHLELMTRYLLVFDSYGLLLWAALPDERTGLSFAHDAGPCQRSLSRVRVPLDSRSYFSVSDLRLPFPSPPTTRGVTVEVFDPASTRGSSWSRSHSLLHSLGADYKENTSIA